jgi:hypothetical protein
VRRGEAVAVEETNRTMSGLQDDDDSSSETVHPATYIMSAACARLLAV